MPCVGTVKKNPQNTRIEKLEKSKENTTRDIEIKNIVTIARGEWGGDNGEKGL